MKIGRIKAIARKEISQIVRDPFSLTMAFAMPVALFIIFGYAITFDINRIPAVIYDREKSALSRGLVDAFTASGYFTAVADIENPDEIDRALDTRLARVAVIIPEHFTRDLETRRISRVQVILDGSDSNTATIAEGYAMSVAERYSETIGGSITPLIESRGRVWYNTDLRSRNFIVPGLIAVIMSVIVSVLTSLTIAREWERGTMERLIATPVKTHEILIGKLIPYYIIGFIDMLMTTMMGTVLFDVPMKGSLLLLMAFSALFLFGGVSLGMLISIAAGGSQLIAFQIAMFTTFLPTVLLSGFVFSIFNMPAVLQIITYIVPARYFVTVLKGIFMKGNGIGLLLPEAIMLIIFSALVFTLANLKFKKRIE